jgi:hypothetical protein
MPNQSKKLLTRCVTTYGSSTTPSAPKKPAQANRSERSVHHNGLELSRLVSPRPVSRNR